MTPTTLPKIFRANLGEVSHALESYEEQGFTGEQADELFAWCDFLAGMSRWSWARIQDNLQEGMEGRRLSAVLRGVCGQLEESLRMFARFRQAVIAAAPPGPTLNANLHKLDRTTQEVEQLRQRMASLSARVDAPLPPIDPSQFAKDEAAPTAEGYESSEQILARLQSGGDI